MDKISFQVKKLLVLWPDQRVAQQDGFRVFPEFLKKENAVIQELLEFQKSSTVELLTSSPGTFGKRPWERGCRFITKQLKFLSSHSIQRNSSLNFTP